MMSLQEEKNDSNLYFLEYKSGSIKLNIGEYNQAVLISAQTVIEYTGEINTLNDVDKSHVELLLKDNPEVVLIGTGQKQELPIIAIVAQLAKAGKSVDFMASDKACKTYNLLVNEGRHVSCIII